MLAWSFIARQRSLRSWSDTATRFHRHPRYLSMDDTRFRLSAHRPVGMKLGACSTANPLRPPSFRGDPFTE